MRRIKKAHIKRISLCKRGANKLPVLYKSKDKSFQMSTLVKTPDDFMDKGEITSIVYAPEFRDYEGDIASAEVIKQMMYDSARDGIEIDIEHDGKPLDKSQAFIAEQFIIQKGDPRFTEMKDYDGNPVDVTGSWATVVKIDDPQLRKLYKSGDWNGVSMFGPAVLELNKEDTATRVVNALVEKFNFKNMHISGDIEMTPEELKAILDERDSKLIEGFASVVVKTMEKHGIKPVTPESNPSAKDTQEDLIFKGDPTVENIKAHRVKVAKSKLLSDVDWTDPESVATLEKGLADLEAAPLTKADGTSEAGTLSQEEISAGVEKSDSEEVKTLKLSLSKAQGRSNQSANEGSSSNTTLSKENKDCIDAGSSMAKYVNDMN